jgi:hypothetical protein
VIGRRGDLAAEDTIANRNIEQHQRKYEQAFPPEHEGETGMRRRGLFDRDNKRNHVGPERQGKCSERRYEDQHDHVKRPIVVVTEDTLGEYRRGTDAD